MSTNSTYSRTEEHTLGEDRIQPRRSGRATRSVSPSSTTMEGGVSEEESNNTRSHSVESSEYETAESKKRKRKAVSKASNKRQANAKLESFKQEENERELRNSSQRVSKEAKEARKAERENTIKEKLNELDKIEKAVRDGSHAEYHKLLAKIEDKRNKMLIVAKMRRSLAEGVVYNLFNSQRECAYSQYYWDKLTLRRVMIENVQRKISKLEQEYYTSHQNYSDDDRLADWMPPERPSTISSLTLGLTEQEIDRDLVLAARDPRQAYSPTSPSIDMLASLADKQYQRDFKKDATDKSSALPSLPSLNPMHLNNLGGSNCSSSSSSSSSNSNTNVK
ncbi:hypothetical protein BCV72DRAFT_259269 [Rhizopus microsporus var. microsporus]|uniref:Uncharacterized protein n=1 Tax=Rhizopus microsporus var. microsporus TaxID=86635 RepID=A0A1X0RJ09_RHIZD|nr:hypothetical protein BCV72DRAFT_259269 [Rhizopus microsporus var. microsporus]